MINLVTLLLVFLLTLASVIVLRPLAFKYKLLDVPNNRKTHLGRIPLIGGIAMLIGVFFGLALNKFIYSSFYISFIISSLILLILGVIDDYKNISPLKRFFFQILASLIIIFIGGVLLEDLGSLISNLNLTLGSFAVIFSVFSILGVLNSLNFSDGIDGLSGSISLISYSSVAFFAYLAKDFEAVNFILCFVSSILAFLIFNIGLGKSNRYRIFMGDAGSTFLGLGIAFSLISYSQSDYLFFSPVTALWIYAIPLLDSVSIMIRRVVNGKSPLSPDREHLHHYIISRGYSERQALLIIILLSLAMAIIGIAFEINNFSERVMFSAFIVISFLYYLLLNYAWKKMSLKKLKLKTK